MVIFPPKLPKNGVGNNSTFFFLLSLTTIILFIRKYLSQNAMLLVRESFRVVKKNLNRDCCKIREIGRIFLPIFCFWRTLAVKWGVIFEFYRYCEKYRVD